MQVQVQPGQLRRTLTQNEKQKEWGCGSDAEHSSSTPKAPRPVPSTRKQDQTRHEKTVIDAGRGQEGLSKPRVRAESEAQKATPRAGAEYLGRGSCTRPCGATVQFATEQERSQGAGRK